MFFFDLLCTLAIIPLTTTFVTLLPDMSSTGVVDISISVYLLIALIWMIVFHIVPVYNARRMMKLKVEITNVVSAIIVALIAFGGIVYIADIPLPRSFLLALFVLEVIFLLGGRLIVRAALRIAGVSTYPRRPVLIIGTNELGQHAARVVQQYAWAGLEVAGFLRAGEPRQNSKLTILGNFDQVREVVERYDIREVVIALRNEDYDKINAILLALQLTPVYVLLVPDYLSLRLYHATSGNDLPFGYVPDQGTDDYANLQFINLRAPVLTARQYFIKRSFDIVISSALIMLFLPLMAAIALAIKLDSPGPIIFRQKRVGENTHLFHMYKFRSMVQNAEALQNQVNQRDKDGNVVHKVANDWRVTRVGRFIRRTSLDEMPQLFNVLKGDMSLVGPRPELPWLVHNYESWQVKRFAVPQGITGWWQVNGRSNHLMHLNSEYDLYYVDRYSFLLDLWILLKTIPAVLQRRGAF